MAKYSNGLMTNSIRQYRRDILEGINRRCSILAAIGLMLTIVGFVIGIIF